MRNYLKKSGLAAIILISMAAMALLPNNIAQWIIIGTVATFTATKGIIYCMKHKDIVSEKFKNVFKPQRRGYKHKLKRKKKLSAVPFEFKYAVNQLAYRITDKLQLAFPESTWHWVDNPTSKLFTDGGRARISTSKTGEFDEADVILDEYGRIEIKMLKTNIITDSKKSSESVITEHTADVKLWYEQCGQKVLTDIITDLNARGTKTLSITYDGNIVIDDNNCIAELKAFPEKNLWKKLIGIFQENGLMAIENENSIQLGW